MEKESTPKKRKMKTVEYLFCFTVLIVAIVAEIFVEDIITSIESIESIIPETYVYLGTEIPNGYIKKIKSLGLIEEDEKIEYFYTDAFFDIQTGMYFVTNRRLILYNLSWEEPKTVIDFNSIIKLVPEYDNTFLGESIILVETDDLEVYFPLSNEKKRDRDFVHFLEQKIDVE